MAQGSSNPTSNLTKINGTAVSVNSGVKDAGTQRVILASDQTAVPITDNGGSLTVDGTVGISGTVPVSIASTVTVTGALTDTQLRASAVPVSLASVPTHGVTGTFWQATQPVSLASVPSHAVTNAGTFAVQVDGSALTALQLIDDTVIADNTAIGTTKLIAVGGTDGTNSQMLSVNTSGHVNIADGGNSITVDGTVGISGTVPVSIASTVTVTGALTDTQLRASAVPVSLASVPTHGVTGTFWQATQPVSIAATVTTKGQTLTNTTTVAFANNLLIKVSAGTLFTLTGYSSKTTDQFIQVHDSATLPGDTAIPRVIFRVPSNSNFSLDFGTYGRSFVNGIVVCNSSTPTTKAIGAADCWFDAQSI